VKVKAMLAYLFWHTRKEAAPRERYERNLSAFYDALRQIGCPGVGRSDSFRISSLPWLDGQPGYEDWTIIDGAWALEELNAKAVVGSMEVLHAAIAREMDVGYGGLYYHLWGELAPHAADRAYWLSRPRGIEFRPALEQIAQSAGAPLAVWRRFMVLGPGTEFVILGRGLHALEVPDGWRVNVVERGALASASPEPAPFLPASRPARVRAGSRGLHRSPRRRPE
jgi:hypothetical protein